MKKYSDKGWNWLIDHYPHEPGRYWFEGFNPVEGYPNKPDLTRKDIHVLADVDDITHPLDATAVTNGEPLYNLFFFATLPGADNLGSVRISVSGEVIPGAAQRGCPLFFVMQYARPDAIARVV